MTERDEEREERIKSRIIVDAYNREEQAMGWSAYLRDIMQFPFEARCIPERDVSPLDEGETVRAVGVPQTAPSLKRMFVTVAWKNRELGVPLGQLEPADASDATERAIADWHYWLER
jgi:hypothetical protein